MKRPNLKTPDRALGLTSLGRQARDRKAYKAEAAERQAAAAEGDQRTRRSNSTFLLAAGCLLLLLLVGLASRSLFSAATGPPVSIAMPFMPLPVLPADAAGGFLKATSHAGRLHWIRHPDYAAPILEKFYASGPGSRETVADHFPLAEPALDQGLMNRPFQMTGRFAVEMQDGSKRLLCTVEENGETKVDFLAYARHQEVPWEKIVSGGTAAAVVRLIIQPGSFYAAPFADSSRWQAITGTSPDFPQDLTLYVLRAAEECDILMALAAEGPRRVRLEISPVPDPTHRLQFQIKSLVSLDWLEPAH